MSYKNLQICVLAKEVVNEIHKMSLNLPKFETYEVGSQIRRSSKSVKSNIVEGYGRRDYKNEYKRFITFALASNDETINHLETLFETGSLPDKETYNEIREKLEKLGKKINQFLQSIKRQHISEK